MTSALEAEVAALLYNFKSAIPLIISLEEMGHNRTKTPVTTDNTTSQGLITKTTIPKRAKSYDTGFKFLKCRESQKQFDFIWSRGKDNMADY